MKSAEPEAMTVAIEPVVGPWSSGAVSAPGYEGRNRGAAFDAVFSSPQFSAVRKRVSMHELRGVINAIADALLQPNAQVQPRSASGANLDE